MADASSTPLRFPTKRSYIILVFPWSPISRVRINRPALMAPFSLDEKAVDAMAFYLHEDRPIGSRVAKTSSSDVQFRSCRQRFSRLCTGDWKAFLIVPRCIAIIAEASFWKKYEVATGVCTTPFPRLVIARQLVRSRSKRVMNRSMNRVRPKITARNSRISSDDGTARRKQMVNLPRARCAAFVVLYYS